MEIGTESNHGGGRVGRAAPGGWAGRAPPSLASRSTPCASDRPPCTPPTCTPCSRTHLTRRLNRCPLPGAERDSLASSKCRTPSSRPLTVPFGPCSSGLPHSLPLAPSITCLSCAENWAHPRSPRRGRLTRAQVEGCNLALLITPSFSQAEKIDKIRLIQHHIRHIVTAPVSARTPPCVPQGSASPRWLSPGSARWPQAPRCGLCSHTWMRQRRVALQAAEVKPQSTNLKSQNSTQLHTASA